MPNAFAYLALLGWPVVGLVLFATLPPARALIWTVLGGYLILPPVANIDLPLLPRLDKFSIANLTALAGVLFIARVPLRILPREPVALFLVILLVVSPLATVMVNREPLLFQAAMIPGLSPYDGISALMENLILIIPFFLARAMLSMPGAHREILFALMIAGFLYTLPILIEVRFSPQLNTWIYGFFPHPDFSQAIRGGGFRPTAFLSHGLLVAMLMVFAVASAAVLRREAAGLRRLVMSAVTAFFIVLIILCKTLSALLYVLFLVPVITVLRSRHQVLIAAMFAVLAISYPILRGGGLVPVETMLEYAEAVNPDRAQSLGFRFNNEQQMLNRAQEKPLLGWGLYGRFHIHDPVTGEELSIADGRWIIVIGSWGWFGYIAEFGLLCLPLFLIYKRSGRRGQEAVPFATSGLALILGINLVDLLPNASTIPMTWLIAGGLLGYAEWLATQRSAPTRASLRRVSRPKRTTR